MKRVILMMAFAIGMTGAYAQKTVKVEKTENNTEKQRIPKTRKPCHYRIRRMQDAVRPPVICLTG